MTNDERAKRIAEAVIEAAISKLRGVTLHPDDSAAVVQAIRSLGRDAIIASVRGPAWSAEPPTEQDWYWHWNGDPDCAPIPTSVLYSGSALKCFISIGQLGITEAIFCDKYGGYWMRMQEPQLPKESHEQD